MAIHAKHPLVKLAELAQAPINEARRWYYRGYLQPTLVVHGTPYFDFEEIRIARLLCQLQASGCSRQMINRRVEKLNRLFPTLERPLAELPLVIVGNEFCVEDGHELTELNGQQLMDFVRPSETAEDAYAIGMDSVDRLERKHDFRSLGGA